MLTNTVNRLVLWQANGNYRAKSTAATHKHLGQYRGFMIKKSGLMSDQVIEQKLDVRQQLTANPVCTYTTLNNYFIIRLHLPTID